MEKSIKKVIKTISSFGVPGLILLITIGVFGIGEVAFLVGPLAFLGGPFGLLGVIGISSLIGVIYRGVSKYGFERIFKEVLEELIKKGESKTTIIKKIEKYRLPESIKPKLIDYIKETEIEELYSAETDNKTKLKNKDEITQEESVIINELRAEHIKEEINYKKPVQGLRVLVFGETRLSSAIIRQIFNEHFRNAFNDEMNKNCVIAVNLQYKSTKNSNLNRKILNNKFDFIIMGPHDHSSKDKSSKESYEAYAENNNLKAQLFKNLKNPMSKSFMEKCAIDIIEEWKKQVLEG